jgi:DNA-binding transcriptional ArsR family regulator
MKSYQEHNDLPFTVADKRKTHYFTVDNILLDTYGKELGPYAIAVYAALARFSNSEQVCWPSKRAISERTGVSIPQVSRELSKLEGYGLISITPQVTERGDQTSNLYTLLDIPENPHISVIRPPVSGRDAPHIREIRKQSSLKKVTPPNSKKKGDGRKNYRPAEYDDSILG